MTDISSTATALPINSTIGILGDGQLGRMMALAAAPLGYQVHIFGPTVHSPAAQVAAHQTVAEYTNQDALTAFANSVDVVTLEFENVPTSALDLIARQTPVRPNARALSIMQDRIQEKTYLQSLGLHVPPFAAIHTRDDLEQARASIGPDGVLKTARFGYDGKGQVRLDAQSSLETAWHTIGGQPAIYEAYIPFDRELSVVLARSTNGDMAVYEPSHNQHRDHILHTSTVPSGLAAYLNQHIQDMACRVAEDLQYVGVMALEVFLAGDDRILINEMAPRPHNSGHWTIDACLYSQFDQAIRAICGLPLGHTDRWADAVMTNLIGDDITHVPQLIQTPGTAVHLYGKAEVKPGRKMGHYTTLHTGGTRT